MPLIIWFYFDSLPLLFWPRAEILSLYDFILTLFHYYIDLGQKSYQNFRWFFGQFEDTKRTFQINWPLAGTVTMILEFPANINYQSRWICLGSLAHDLLLYNHGGWRCRYDCYSVPFLLTFFISLSIKSWCTLN